MLALRSILAGEASGAAERGEEARSAILRAWAGPRLLPFMDRVGQSPTIKVSLMCRPRILRPSGFLLAVLLAACGAEHPTAPGLAVGPPAATVSAASTTEDASGTAEALLDDPFLAVLVSSLSQPAASAAILDALEAVRRALTLGQTDATLRRLEDAYAALAAYAEAIPDNDDDVLHLDTIELFLDEIEAVIEPEGSTPKNGRKPRTN
ncbi:MAG TPA: hypothetical protein VK858_00900 [Longimicrobiales bacterium]|nr:hypothetical protein [Longimicrobiales bacterium]